MTHPVEATTRSLRAKRRTIAGILLLLALWPLAHRVLVARHDVNPWKFFGWAMYCRPPGTIALEIHAVPAGDETVAVPSDWEIRTAHFLRWRRHAGTLVGPGRLGRTLLELNPELTAAEIQVTHTRLDSRSARVQSRRFDYRFAREAPP